MSSPDESSASILAIILGASAWPDAPELAAGKPFENSARSFIKYLIEDTGLGLPKENLLDLFDSEGSPNDIDREISKFLKGRVRFRDSAGPRDLIIYYVGHGGFTEKDEYFLALRSTRSKAEGASSYRVTDLAKTLNEDGSRLRRYLILDSCFSAAANAAFQSSPLQIARRQVEEALPARGTALLCSSGPRDPSKIPPGEIYTMFSGALLEILQRPAVEDNTWLSLWDLGESIRQLIKDRYPDNGIRPEVQSPDQRTGDVANIPIFPTFAARQKKAIGLLHAVDARLERVEKQLAQDRLRKLEDRIHQLETDAREISTNYDSRIDAALKRVAALENNPSTRTSVAGIRAPGLTLVGRVESEHRHIRADRGEAIVWHSAQRLGFMWLLVTLIVCFTSIVVGLLVKRHITGSGLSWVPGGINALQAVMGILSVAMLSRHERIEWGAQTKVHEDMSNAVSGLSYLITRHIRVASPFLETSIVLHALTAISVWSGLLERLH